MSTVENIVNINSEHRHTISKHILSNIYTLDNDPLEFKQNSNIVTVNLKNHNLNIGNRITIQNCSGKIYNMYNILYLINGIEYLIINMEHGIPLNYSNELYFKLSIVDQSIVKIDNIYSNDINGIKRGYIFNDLNISESFFEKIVNDLFNINVYENTNILNTNFIFIKLRNKYNNINVNYMPINTIIYVEYLHNYGISNKYINANFPIGVNNYSDSHAITNVIDNNIFEITLKKNSYSSGIGGGNNLIVGHIINTHIGYENPNDYVIELNRTYNNVINIDIISMELPYVNSNVKEGINNKLSWRNLEDGIVIYNIYLEEGYYNISSLLEKLIQKMNSVPRLSSLVDTSFHEFDIKYNESNNEITFSLYTTVPLPNSLYIDKILINNDFYYTLNIFYDNGYLEIGNEISINNSLNMTFNENSLYHIISNEHINTNHIIYNLNRKNNIYTVILGKIDNIETDIGTEKSLCGKNVSIKHNIPFSLIFDTNDTIGSLLGFRDIGYSNSITDFEFKISNKYIFYISDNSIGTNNNFINVETINSYIMLYLNDIEIVHDTINESYFAKILMIENIGNILYNTFISNPSDAYSKSYPIKSLDSLHVQFKYPNGHHVNFGRLNHSFTLKISELIDSSTNN